MSSTSSSMVVHRFLPAGSFEGILDSIEQRVRQVFETPVANWDSAQWFTAGVLLFVGLWCCGCICQQRRRPYYGRGNGYYPNQQQAGLMTAGGGGGGGGSCLRNVVMCACCYELCCRDCQDLQSILPAGMLQKLPNETDSEYARHNDRMERGGAGSPTVAIV